MVRALAFTSVFLVGTLPVVTSLDCQQLCSEIRDEVKPGIACRNHRKILPRPKVGNACMSSYWEGFTDACFATCSGETPTSMLGNVCRAARKEMPKPMVYRSCETGYNTGFAEASGKVVEFVRERSRARTPEEILEDQKAEEAKAEQEAAAKEAQELEMKAKEQEEAAAAAATAAAAEAAAAAEEVAKKSEPEPEQPSATPEKTSKLRGEKKEPEPEPEPEPEAEPEPEPAAEATEAEEDAPVVATLPVTVDEKEIMLTLRKGVDPEVAVAEFCAKHMPGVDACSGQLLPHVLKKLEEGGVSAE